MKLCQNCGERPSALVIETSVAGQSKELCLCLSCAQKMGLAESRPSFELNAQPQQVGRVCPNCGTSELQFLESGFVGCAHCYYVFSGIEQSAEKWHGKTEHTGKRSKNRVLSREHLETLMARLRRATMQKNLDEVKVLKEEIELMRANCAKK